jgi:hypothetical protein
VEVVITKYALVDIVHLINAVELAPLVALPGHVSKVT